MGIRKFGLRVGNRHSHTLNGLLQVPKHPDFRRNGQARILNSANELKTFSQFSNGSKNFLQIESKLLETTEALCL